MLCRHKCNDRFAVDALLRWLRLGTIIDASAGYPCCDKHVPSEHKPSGIAKLRTVRAPPTPRSSVVTGSPAREVPTTMRPSRSRMSCRLDVSASTAMISLRVQCSDCFPNYALRCRG